MKQLLFLFLMLAVTVEAARRRPPPESGPRINRSAPITLRAGQSIELKFLGEHLEDMSSLWTSFPATSEKLKISSSEALFRLTIPTNVPVQIGAARLVGTNVLSNLYLLMIDDLPPVAKTNATKEAPQWVAGGQALDGRIEELQTDYFTFPAKKGEEWSIDLLARRVGSTLDPLLRILDPGGRELVYSLQFSDPNGDPRIRFKAPDSARYTIELRDVGYRGGANFFYHLRFGKFPLITSTYPSFAERAAKPKIGFAGIAVKGALATAVPSGESNSLPVTGEFKGVRGSGFSILRFSNLPQVTEVEPNDKAAQALKIKLPIGLNGRFDKPRDVDAWEIVANKGDRLFFSSKTRSLGSPCDVSMRLVNTNGTQLAESSNTGAAEATLSSSIEKTGTYRLLVEELTGAAAPDLFYHIEAKTQLAGFFLFTENDKGEKSTNGGVVINVTCVRDNFDGPINLSLKGLDSCRLENAVIEKKKTNTALRIFLPRAMQEADLAVVRIVGEATISEKQFSDEASTVPALRKAFPMLIYPPDQFDGLIWLTPPPD